MHRQSIQRALLDIAAGERDRPPRVNALRYIHECAIAEFGGVIEPEALPDAANIVFMAGMKFGTTGQESLIWAMNSFWHRQRKISQEQNRGVLHRQCLWARGRAISGPASHGETSLSPHDCNWDSNLGDEDRETPITHRETSAISDALFAMRTRVGPIFRHTPKIRIAHYRAPTRRTTH